MGCSTFSISTRNKTKTYILVALQGQIPLRHRALLGRIHLVVGSVADRDGEALGGNVQGKILTLCFVRTCERDVALWARVCACVPGASLLEMCRVNGERVMQICPAIIQDLP